MTDLTRRQFIATSLAACGALAAPLVFGYGALGKVRPKPPRPTPSPTASPTPSPTPRPTASPTPSPSPPPIPTGGAFAGLAFSPAFAVLYDWPDTPHIAI